MVPAPIVVSGADEASLEFGKSLASSLGLEMDTLIEKVFPDGEVYVRLPHEVVGRKHVILVQTFAPPQDRSIMKTLLAVDALKSKGVERITLIAPYLAYSRQDREFLPNEAVSIRALLRILRGVGVSELYTVEVHKEDSLKYFEGPAYSISPYNLMASMIQVKSDALVLAPDEGALKRARLLANSLGVEYDFLVKKRDRVTGSISFEPKEVEVKGKYVIIVDDVISTGGTVAKASKAMYARGARGAVVVVAHALMVGEALRKLKEAGVVKVYSANTLPKIRDPLIEYVDVAPLVAEALKVRM